jgi:hypothetical protein
LLTRVLPDIGIGSWLCENSGAKLTNPTFEEFLPVLGDLKPADRKSSI